MVGVVLPFSLTRRMEEGANRGQLYRHIFQRFVLLFLFGLIYNGLLDFNTHTCAFPEFCSASPLLTDCRAGDDEHRHSRPGDCGRQHFDRLLADHEVGPGPRHGVAILTPEGNLAGYLDLRFIPFKLCCYTFGDNEGIISTLPAIATCLLGVLAGHWLRSGKYTPNRKVLGLAAAGVASLFIAWVWSFNFPIIKNIWSSTFVLWAGGWSMLLLALFYWIIDVRGYQRWAFYFKVIGMNSITIYLLDRFFDFGIITKVFLHGIMPVFGQLQPLVWSCAVIFTGWLLLYFLYRQKIFLRV